MRLRFAGRIGCSLVLFVAGGSGCAALGAATTGVTQTTGAVQGATGALDGA